MPIEALSSGSSQSRLTHRTSHIPTEKHPPILLLKMPVAAAAVGGDAESAKLDMWKEALYEKTRKSVGEGEAFSQQDLLALDVIPNKDLALLARVLQALSNEKLFITMRENTGQPVWKWKDPQEANK